MTWQIATYAVLVAVLIGGFAWYERSRPPAQVVAMVAALAALAVAGRIAFAVIPNLVATTDIIIFTGYALGPAPGFVAGALTGLVSNFWLGQGPWTPWQMAGWGLCGVYGAFLATLTTRTIGRFPLAIACGAAGILFGLMMNFSVMVTYGGDISLARFLALQVRAIPFDLAHALGNFTLALIAGPAMIRMLSRFQARFQWRRVAPAAATVAAITVAAFAFPTGQAKANGGDDLDAAVGWIGSVQNADGGFGPSPGDESSTVTTSWVILGLAANGVNAHDLSARGGANPINFLRRNADSVTSTGDTARTILALNSAGVDPRSFEGRNLIADLRGRRRNNGSYENWPNTSAFAVLALRQSGATGGLRATLDWLRSVQNEDGGWGSAPGTPSEADSTGAVLQAIGGTEAVRNGVAFLRKTQRPSGGWPLGGAGAVNTQSTAWAIQGLIAAGVNPANVKNGQNSGLDYLASRQNQDGHYRYSGESDQTPVWVTAQAMAAAALKTFPIAEPEREPAPEPAPMPRPAPPPAPAPAPSGPSVIPAPPPPTGGGGSSPSFGGRGGGGNQVEPRPIDPDAFAPPSGPDQSVSPDDDEGGPPADSTLTEPLGAESVPDAAGAKRPAPSPAAPAGIGLGLAGLTAGGMWWMGRRRAW